MTEMNIADKNKHFWVHKEYKHVADVYCAEWETPNWYTVQQAGLKVAAAAAAKKTEEAAKAAPAAGAAKPGAAAPGAAAPFAGGLPPEL
jgi:hypothetical protein